MYKAYFSQHLFSLIKYNYSLYEAKIKTTPNIT